MFRFAAVALAVLCFAGDTLAQGIRNCNVPVNAFRGGFNRGGFGRGFGHGNFCGTSPVIIAQPTVIPSLGFGGFGGGFGYGGFNSGFGFGSGCYGAVPQMIPQVVPQVVPQVIPQLGFGAGIQSPCVSGFGYGGGFGAGIPCATGGFGFGAGVCGNGGLGFGGFAAGGHCGVQTAGFGFNNGFNHGFNNFNRFGRGFNFGNRGLFNDGRGVGAGLLNVGANLLQGVLGGGFGGFGNNRFAGNRGFAFRGRR